VVDAQGLARAIGAIRAVPEFAVDLEAEAMHAFRARLCYLQLGTDADIFLLDTLQPEVRAEALGPLFEDAGRTKFIHAAGGDLQYLAEKGVRVAGLFDTHRAATLLGWPKVGLADLVREQLGVELKKEHQQADFSIRPLPSSMREYIADDVRYLTEIGRRVRQACRDADILEEVQLDCDRMAADAVGRPEVAAFRLKLPRTGFTEPQRRLAYALAAELHALRLKWAEAANVPMGMMLSNMAITEIAKSPPADLRSLAKSPGVRGSFVRTHGDEVLAKIQELKARADRGELPAPEADARPPDPKRRKREELLKDFRSKKAAERKVTPSVVLPTALVEELANEPPSDRAALERIPWIGEKRLRLYGDELLALLGRV
ncbi:MAG: ribonuclease D, partial [Myxococcales bacterium]